MGDGKETRATRNLAGNNGAEASQEKPTSTMDRAEISTECSAQEQAEFYPSPCVPCITPRAYASRDHVERAPRHPEPAVSVPGLRSHRKQSLLADV